MNGVKFIGSYRGQAGYSCSARGYIRALHSLDIPLTLTNAGIDRHIVFDSQFEAILSECENKDIQYDTVIINLAPEYSLPYYESDKRNILMTVWETDRLPTKWVEIINKYYDVVTVPSEWNQHIFAHFCISSVYCIPHVVEIDNKFVKSPNRKTKDEIIFYYIAQWQNRKNVQDLLISYFTRFYGVSNVRLRLKTYHVGGYSQKCKEAILYRINAIKDSLNLRNSLLPKLELYLNIMNENDLYNLHNASDCYISPSSSEGFGLPIYEALIIGNPVLATGFSAYSNDIPNEWHIEYDIVPVHSMTDISREYNASMNWAKPRIKSIQDKMWSFFCGELSLKHNFDREKLSVKSIAEKMKNILF